VNQKEERKSETKRTTLNAITSNQQNQKSTTSLPNAKYTPKKFDKLITKKTPTAA
jgi:hypothetical protein